MKKLKHMDYYTKKIISFKDVVFKKTKTMKLWENIRKKKSTKEELLFGSSCFKQYQNANRSRIY